jgi:hypothetical protein
VTTYQILSFLYQVMISLDVTGIDMGVHGILIFVKSELCASPITYPLPPTELEFLPLSVDFCKLKFCIAVFYRPPSSDVNYL